jgi:hypothetical protein
VQGEKQKIITLSDRVMADAYAAERPLQSWLLRIDYLGTPTLVGLIICQNCDFIIIRQCVH